MSSPIPTAPTATQLSYAERLSRKVERKRSLLCAGIDPSPDALALLDLGDSRHPSELRGAELAGAIERFASYVIDAARDYAVAVKPQISWFERAGADGMLALQRTVLYARRSDLLVVLDAKRGDIAHSAQAYAQAYLGDAATTGICCDALTVNGWIGADALEVFAAHAHSCNTQVYALVHTSNPGGPALQDAPLADGRAWWQLMAAHVEQLGVGAVVGATHAEQFAALRKAMPSAPLLIPGIGAQGGAMAGLAGLTATAAPPSLINASRGLLPTRPAGVGGFRVAVTERCSDLAARTATLVPR